MSTVSPATFDDRAAQVWERLQAVTDPELDESVTELGFVTAVEADAEGAVKIAFRLPTYWCAANFAFLMADDMRAAAESLPWTTSVALELDEHMYADEINRGVSNRLSFQQSFGDEASDDLAQLRQTFLVKAFQRRQEALLSHLLLREHDASQVLALRVGELVEMPKADAETRRLIDRYIERRFVVGEEVGDTQRSEARAFVDSENAPLDGQSLGAYLRALRRVGVNAEFNGALCRGLLATRYEDASASASEVEVKPVEFVPRHEYQAMRANAATLAGNTRLAP